MLFDGAGPAQVIEESDAGVVHEEVERAHLLDRLKDLRGAGHVQPQGPHPRVGVRNDGAHARVDSLRPPSERLIDEGLADAAVGTRDQDCLL